MNNHMTNGIEHGGSPIGAYAVEAVVEYGDCYPGGAVHYFQCTLRCINGFEYEGRGSYKSVALKKAFAKASEAILLTATDSLI